MIKPNLKLLRALGTKKPRKIFHLFTEGKTESEYFEEIVKKSPEYELLNVTIKCHPANGKTTAKQILNKAQRFITQIQFEDQAQPNENTYIWLIIDVDNNPPEDIQLCLE